MHPQKKNIALIAIREYYKEYGYSPTYKELGEILGIGWVAAHNRVKELERDGKVLTHRGLWRNIVLLHKEE